MRRPDLHRREALELAVVEFAQALVQLDPLTESGERARLDRATHRAREDVVERPPRKQLADRDGLEPPLRRERDVGASRVLSRDRPLGFAVSDQPDRHGQEPRPGSTRAGGLPDSNICSIVPDMAPEPLFEIARRRFDTPEFRGIEFIESECKTIINHVPGNYLPFSWSINPYRGCSHSCSYLLRTPDAHLPRHGRGA